jgi:hypothetical protein
MFNKGQQKYGFVNDFNLLCARMFIHANSHFRTENPRVAGSIPALGTIFADRVSRLII